MEYDKSLFGYINRKDNWEWVSDVWKNKYLDSNIYIQWLFLLYDYQN